MESQRDRYRANELRDRGPSRGHVRSVRNVCRASGLRTRTTGQTIAVGASGPPAQRVARQTKEAPRHEIGTSSYLPVLAFDHLDRADDGGPISLLEQFMPRFDTRSRHAIEVEAPAQAVFTAVEAVTVKEVRFLREL